MQFLFLTIQFALSCLISKPTNTFRKRLLKELMEKKRKYVTSAFLLRFMLLSVMKEN